MLEVDEKPPACSLGKQRWGGSGGDTWLASSNTSQVQSGSCAANQLNAVLASYNVDIHQSELNG